MGRPTDALSDQESRFPGVGITPPEEPEPQEGEEEEESRSTARTASPTRASSMRGIVCLYDAAS